MAEPSKLTKLTKMNSPNKALKTKTSKLLEFYSMKLIPYFHGELTGTFYKQICKHKQN
jgi:hypothetical protein